MNLYVVSTVLHFINKEISTKQISIHLTDEPFLTTEIRRKMRQRKRIHKKLKLQKKPRLISPFQREQWWHIAVSRLKSQNSPPNLSNHRMAES